MMQAGQEVKTIWAPLEMISPARFFAISLAISGFLRKNSPAKPQQVSGISRNSTFSQFSIMGFKKSVFLRWQGLWNATL